MLHGLQETVPRFLAFALSVAMVGGNWISSVNIQRIQDKADTTYLTVMVIYLGLISLTPFTCSLIGEHPDNPVSYVVFGVVSLLIAVNAWFYLRNCGLKKVYHKDADLAEIARLERLIPVPAVIPIAMAAAAFYSTQLSLVLLLAYNTLPFFLTKSLRIGQAE